MNLGTIKTIVKKVLENSEEARKDNFVLVEKVYKYLGVPTDISFDSLVRKHIELKLPTFEGITRARRNVVKEFPELNGNIEIRKNEEQKYREFAMED